jgi:hypothetical protein
MPTNEKAAQTGGLGRGAKNYAQDFCEAGAFFALAAFFLRLM